MSAEPENIEQWVSKAMAAGQGRIILQGRIDAELERHQPYTDDGAQYCGWDGHNGCGETYPCTTRRTLTGRTP